MSMPANDLTSNKAENPESQPRPLLKMFSAVPDHYDFLNRVLTGGFDERWRRQVARKALCGRPLRVLDLCCGTGDLTLHMARFAANGEQIVGLDFCEPMLEVARAKAAKMHLENRVTFLHGDASNLPFPDGHFSSMGMSFAFRNLTYHNPLTPRFLSEIVRVMATGGKFIVVETSQPRNPILRSAYHLYMRTIVPTTGKIFSQRGPYQYLGESARGFFKPEEVIQMLTDAGFKKAESHPLLSGIAAIHIATK